MNFRFSFTNKNELIYIKNSCQIKPIGCLIKQLIDTDWEEMKHEFSARLLDNEIYEEEILQDIKRQIGRTFSHPALVYVLLETVDAKELFSQVERLITARKVVLHILESLVDEEQNSYEEHLAHLMVTEQNEKLKNYFENLGDAKVLLFEERNRTIYSEAIDFPYLFETEDLVTIIIQEIQFLCTSKFYIRKCALCKKFIWTRKMNQVYCNRKFGDTRKTCAQIGPVKVWQNGRPKAYALYWTYRMRLSSRAAADETDYEYQQWLIQTEKYRDMAKNDEIKCEDMENVLKSIEYEIYNNAV